MGRQQRAEAPHGLQGSLYHATEDGRTKGRGNENAQDTKTAKESNIRE